MYESVLEFAQALLRTKNQENTARPIYFYIFGLTLDIEYCKGRFPFFFSAVSSNVSPAAKTVSLFCDYKKVATCMCVKFMQLGAIHQYSFSHFFKSKDHLTFKKNPLTILYFALFGRISKFLVLSKIKFYCSQYFNIINTVKMKPAALNRFKYL